MFFSRQGPFTPNSFAKASDKDTIFTTLLGQVDLTLGLRCECRSLRFAEMADEPSALQIMAWMGLCGPTILSGSTPDMLGDPQ